MSVIDGGEVPEFYKILFEILLLYILLLNCFFILGNFIFYFFELFNIL